MACELIPAKRDPNGCKLCNKKLTGRQKTWCSRQCSREYTRNHRWTNAKAHIKKEGAWYQCSHCQEFTKTIEVNHIVPCKGKHGQWGCHHHETNLELVCRPCHKIETNKQRARGWK